MGFYGGNGNGYDGWSMSNNARYAYDNGEMPLSKWRKGDILSTVEDWCDDNDIKVKDSLLDLLNSYKAETLKDSLLKYTSWHHSSKFYNEIDFYGLDETFLEDYINDLAKMKEILDRRQAWILENKKPKAKYSDDLKYVLVEYSVWEGTRNHPKLKDYTSYAIVKGAWVYLRNGKRKKLNGSKMNITKEFNRVPKGTKEIFDEIRSSIK